MEKILYIIRGASGSGKTSFANSLECHVFSADDYFTSTDGTEYKFDSSKLKLAHEYCQDFTTKYMKFGEPKIAVANTFTREWEMEPYFTLAKLYGYTVFTVIVENRHGGKNVHGVSPEMVQAQKDRFEIKL